MAMGLQCETMSSSGEFREFAGAFQGLATSRIVKAGL
jgi:hypothetical protein